MSRLRSASALVGCAGLDSSASQSGRSDGGGGPIARHGSPCLRRALWLAANGARQHDPAPRSSCEGERAEGRCHRVAVAAAARKLCHMVFAVMRDGVPYDPARPGRDQPKHSISGSQGTTKSGCESVEQISL